MRGLSCASLALTLVFALCLPAPAQERPDPSKDFQARCLAARVELAKLTGMADADKRGTVEVALRELVVLIKDAEWVRCLALVDETLHKVL